MKKSWLVRGVEHTLAKELAGIFGIPEVTAFLLAARGLDTPEKGYKFLYPRLSHMHSPFLMKDMDHAVARILRAVELRERIGLFSDSDLDGLTSLTMLVNLLKDMGVDPSPVRFLKNDEKYGITRAMVDEFIREKTCLLITLDSGIRDVEEIDYARKSGIDVIVCDHHEPAETLPDAIIVNPRRKDCPYPYKGLAGVGVTFKLCLAILMSGMPGFNRRYCVMTGEKGGISCSWFVNGDVLRTETIADPRGLAGLMDGTDREGAHAIIYDTGEWEEIRKIFPRERTHDFNRLVNSCLKEKKDRFPLDELMTRFCIPKGVFARKIDIIGEIFREIFSRHSDDREQRRVLDDFIHSALDLVAIGTIADIMPLDGENRIMVRHGIDSINATRHPGLSMLVGKNTMDAKGVGWNIAPLLNTPGRFGKTELTASFFLEKDRKKLDLLLDEIHSLNGDRKDIVVEKYNAVLEEIARGNVDVGRNLLFIQMEIEEGLSGLLANRLADNLNRPTIVVAGTGKDGTMKGSGRTRGNFDFFSFVEPLSHLFEKVGGHAQAFGFSARPENLPLIKKSLEVAIGDCYDREHEFLIDMEMPLEMVTLDFIESLSRLEPFGNRNEEPLFLARNVPLLDFSCIGSGEKHGRYRRLNRQSLEAVGWNMAEEMEQAFRKGTADLLFRLEINTFNGNRSPRMILVDIDA